MDVNDKMVDRIETTLPGVSDPFDREKLVYIKGQLTPQGIERRSEENKAVDHLREAASAVLRPYERVAQHG